MGMARIISGGALCIIAFGCGSRFNYVGTWVGTRTVKEITEANPDIRHTLEKVHLEVRDGGKYVLVDGGMPSEGILTHTSDGADLTPDSIFGRPANRQNPKVAAQFSAKVTVAADGGINFKSEQGDVAHLTRSK